MICLFADFCYTDEESVLEAIELANKLGVGIRNFPPSVTPIIPGDTLEAWRQRMSWDGYHDYIDLKPAVIVNGQAENTYNDS